MIQVMMDYLDDSARARGSDGFSPVFAFVLASVCVRSHVHSCHWHGLVFVSPAVSVSVYFGGLLILDFDHKPAEKC